MANGKTRPRRYYLERITGGRAHVYYVPVPDRRHRATGWYVEPADDVDGCECEFCVGIREQRPVFVGGNSFLAASLLHEYVERHPAPATSAATG